MMLDVEPDIAADPSAFFREFYPRLFREVAAFSGAPRAEVEDLVQETLLRAWRDRERFKGEADLSTWISSIARKRVLDGWRRRSVRDRALAFLKIIEEQPVPDDLLETDELRGAVRKALAAIPPEYADLLIRCYHGEESVREIAEDLGESESAVESRLHRAREAFREALKSRMNDEAV